MHTLVSKLVALSVEKYYMALTEIQSKIYRFHGSLSQEAKKVRDPVSSTCPEIQALTNIVVRTVVGLTFVSCCWVFVTQKANRLSPATHLLVGVRYMQI